MDIGKMSATLVLGGGGKFIGALDQTSRSILGFASTTTAALGLVDSSFSGTADAVVKSAGRIASGITDSMNAAGKAIRKGNLSGALREVLWGTTGGLAGNALAGTFNVATAAVGDFVGAFKDGTNDLIATDTYARQLGMSVLDLRAAMHWAGPAAAEMGSALNSMSDQFVKLRMGTTAARQDFAGLSAISGKSIAELQAGGSLGLIDAIAAIPDPATRAAQAFKFLGSSAGPLLQQLREGGAAGSKDFMKRLGLDASGAEVAALHKVSQAMRDIQSIGSGIFNQALLAVGPVAAEVVKLFGDVKIDLTFIKPLIMDIIHNVALFGAFLLESSRNSKLLGDGINLAWEIGSIGFLKFKAVVLDGFAQIARMMPNIGKSWEVAAIMKKYAMAGDYSPAAHAKAMAEAKAVAMRDDGYSAAFAAAAKRADLAAAQKQKDLFGSGAPKGILGGLAGVAGGLFGGGPLGGLINFGASFLPKDRGMFGDLMDSLGKTPLGGMVNSLMARARSPKDDRPGEPPGGQKLSAELAKMFSTMRDSVISPAQKFGDSMKHIADMKSANLFAGNPQLEGLFGYKSGMELLGAAGMTGDVRLAGAAEAQSREAYSTLARFDAEGNRGGVQERIASALDLIKSLTERQAVLGQEMLSATQGTEKAVVKVAKALAEDTGGSDWS